MAPTGRFTATLVAIDDDPGSLNLIRAALRREPLEILTATQADAGLELVLKKRPHIVLLDLLMPKMSGLEVLDRILAAAPDTDVILITGHYSTESAVDAIRRGASDYLTKPICVPTLRERVGRLIEQARERYLALDLDGELLKAHQFQGMVGRSPLVRQVFVQIQRVAPHYRTALVTGATGTGKELVARALHQLCPCSAARFEVINCSAVVETLFESELFGYTKGAFTGATQDKVGLFEYASGGTVFLDEIGDMPLETQCKLLRVLESGEVKRLGSPAVRRVDVRIIAATNRDLREMIAGKLFRDDLYYRLSMVQIRLPRLADRRDDLPLLARYFIEQFAAQYDKPIRGLTPRAQLVLARYAWPGNVRELKSALGSACMMADGDLIDVRDFPEELRACAVLDDTAEPEELLPLEEVERRHVLRVLDRVGGNKAQAARVLGINRATIYRLLGEPACEARAGGE